MKILHTSDWHLGKSLHGRKRYDEFQLFLDWMLELVETEKPDALLISGDIFDTITPTNEAQKIYYNFLVNLSRFGCPHTVITAGNHDSPTLLNAPKALLDSLDIHVCALLPENPEDEIIRITDDEGKLLALVCAVPFLRDRDIRKAQPGEGADERNRNIQQGVAAHYEAVCAAAEGIREEAGINIPLIAMGHLFTAGAVVNDEDTIRDLYVGSLGTLDAGIFPDSIDYLALGHIHSHQMVAKNSAMRYSGSPLPMSFKEAGKKKAVLAVEFNEGLPSVREIEVPCFQVLERIEGDIKQIESEIKRLKKESPRAWLEVEYTGSQVIPSLHDEIEKYTGGSTLEVLLVRNRQRYEALLQSSVAGESLEELDEYRVFDIFLAGDTVDIDDEEKKELRLTYREALTAMQQKDTGAQ